MGNFFLPSGWRFFTTRDFFGSPGGDALSSLDFLLCTARMSARCCFTISFSRGVISICSQGCSGAEAVGAVTEGEEVAGVPFLGGALALCAWAVVTSTTPNTTESRYNLMIATPHVARCGRYIRAYTAPIVNNLILSHTLLVASQRSRVCREVMQERRDTTFPVAARPLWVA